MSRALTIVVILLLMAVVALVPRIGTEEQGPDLGDDYAYREDTLARFRLLLEDDGWCLADPPRNSQGMLEAVHGETGLTFVLIPAGEFMMGSEDRETEMPRHRVQVSGFLLSTTEVTNGLYKLMVPDFVFSGVFGTFKPTPGHPAIGVTWEDARFFCSRLSTAISCAIRLPTEAEWEYACRAGSDGKFSFGSDERRLGKYAWHKSGTNDQGTREVGGLAANPWGLFDMHGNVWEWCEDNWHDNYRRAPIDGTAWRGEGNPVIRGGGWADDPERCRSAARDAYSSDALGTDWWDIGFRPAADLPEVK